MDDSYELNEARAEITRHHRDFDRIVSILDDCDSLSYVSLKRTVKNIRNVTG
jgi:hypothetical protein